MQARDIKTALRENRASLLQGIDAGERARLDWLLPDAAAEGAEQQAALDSLCAEMRIRAFAEAAECTRPRAPHLGRTARRLLLVAALVLAMALFMACTPVGRAMAAEIYRVIVEVSGGFLRAHNEGTNAEIESIDFSTLPAEFESLEAVAEATGRPIVVPGNDDALLSFFTDVLDTETMVIMSDYSFDDGGTYTITQDLYNPSTAWGTGSSIVGEIRTLELNIGVTAYLTTMRDGVVYARAFGPEYSIAVTSHFMTLDALEALMMELVLLE